MTLVAVTAAVLVSLYEQGMAVWPPVVIGSNLYALSQSFDPTVHDRIVYKV